jgi:uncharacterized protein YqgC (DUF456 family)
MDFGQAALTLIASIAMVVTFFLAFLPVLPGPILLWGIALIYGLLTSWAELTVPGMVAISVLMIAGTTSDYWLPFIGIKSQGASCNAIVGTILGGLIGTFAIPIPILGTLIGSMVGALLLELLRVGEMKKALFAANFAMKTFLISMAMEIMVNFLILAIFFGVVLG